MLSKKVKQINENNSKNKKDTEGFELADQDMEDISGGRIGRNDEEKNYPGSPSKRKPTAELSDS